MRSIAKEKVPELLEVRITDVVEYPAHIYRAQSPA